MKAFYRTYYSPNNAFIVVAGDFDSGDILKKIQEAFGGIPRGAEPPEVGLTEPPQRGERRVLLKREAQLPSLVMNYHVPNVGHPDSYALDVLEMVLSRGRTSRLYRDLVYDRPHRPLGLGRLPPGLRRSHHFQHRRPGPAGQGHRPGGGGHRRGHRRGPGRGRHAGGTGQGQEPGSRGLHLRPGIQPGAGHEDRVL